MNGEVTLLQPVERLTLLGRTVDRYVYPSRRLQLSFLEWGPADGPVLILLHGGLESAHSWDQIAARLCDRRRVIAADLRGHGDSDWSLGGAYAVVDFVSDIAALMHWRGIGRAALAGHSLGGAVALHLTALYPERVERVCAIEGLRPGFEPRAVSDDERLAELRKWSDDLIDLTTRPRRVYPDRAAAAAHLRKADPRMPAEIATHAAETNTRVTSEGIAWKYDTHMRQFSSTERATPEPREFWQRIECPTLLVYGAESWATDPRIDGRITYFRNARVVTVAHAGHNVQHHQPDAFHDLLADFLQE